jgi:hypothetical protein
MLINDTYQQEVEEWVCTCPAFPVSRFLVLTPRSGDP